nr:MAG TPA: hypothetical protein [Caudoviricetes sp.]DAY23647.1 MAG TPA: hypothetical protein [Caudoviricetes sp.]
MRNLVGTAFESSARGRAPAAPTRRPTLPPLSGTSLPGRRCSWITRRRMRT